MSLYQKLGKTKPRKTKLAHILRCRAKTDRVCTLLGFGIFILKLNEIEFGIIATHCSSFVENYFHSFISSLLSIHFPFHFVALPEIYIFSGVSLYMRIGASPRKSFIVVIWIRSSSFEAPFLA